MKNVIVTQLPIPAFFDRHKAGSVWRVPYQDRANQAEAWAKQHGIAPAATDRKKICLMAIDVQNTFCIPDHDWTLEKIEAKNG